MNSVTKGALEAVGFVLFCTVLYETQLAMRRASTPRDSEPDTSGPWSYRKQWARIRYEGAYGHGIRVVRVLEAVALVVALLIALISWIAG